MELVVLSMQNQTRINEDSPNVNSPFSNEKDALVFWFMRFSLIAPAAHGNTK